MNMDAQDIQDDFRHFSLITTTANSKIVLVLNGMVLVLLLGSPSGVEYDYEYEYRTG